MGTFWLHQYFIFRLKIMELVMFMGKLQFNFNSVV